MESLIVARWTQSGEDRLYVKTAGGYDVGYLDRQTGARVLDDEAWCDAFDLAVATYEVTLDPSEFETDPSWTDLALNQPAQYVRAQAKQLDGPAGPFGPGAEIVIGAELSRLGASWRVLHSVPVGARGSEVDHIVIGPGGVFAVNAKDGPDPRVSVGNDVFILNGPRARSADVGRQVAQQGARILSDTVSFLVPVTGVIAVVRPNGVNPSEQPCDGEVVTLGHSEIEQWLTSQAAVLDEVQVETLYDAARRSTTWV